MTGEAARIIDQFLKIMNISTSTMVDHHDMVAGLRAPKT